MPYSTPSQGRPGHRRSYSHITPPPSYSSTSTSLAHLPRRRPSDAKFQLGRDDDDDDDDDSPDETMTATTLLHDDDGRALPPLRLKLRHSPFDEAVRRASPPPAAIPFPRSSPTASPALPTASLPFAHVRSPSEGADTRLIRPSMSRTSSTPILLSNGKPLKSSLKSSSSSPNIPFPPQSLVPSIMFPDLHQQHKLSYHQRARSAPSTPRLEHIDLASLSPGSTSSSPDLPPSPPSPTFFPQKNVHFPSQEEGGLATVRVFNRSAKPASLSRLGEETETETEGESSASGWGPQRANSWGPRSASTKRSSYNFPVIQGAAPTNPSPLARKVEKSLFLDSQNSSPIPARGAQQANGNVYFESLGFLRQAPDSPLPKRPLVLTGTLLVRNVTYQKTVAIRFTMDDWHTTNDVIARHEKSLGALPGRFVRGASAAFSIADQDRICSPYAVDSIGDAAVVFGDAPAWDRFRFDIQLEDYADSLENRTMWLVGRYSAGVAAGPTLQNTSGTPAAEPISEWWDNNMGANYRVAFERKEYDVPQPPLADNKDNMYKRTTIISAPSAYSPVRPAATSPAQKSYPAPPQISASISLPTTFNEHQQQQKIAEQRQRQAAMTQSTMARLKKLNLMNYAAPATYTAPAAHPISIDSSSTSTSADSTPLQTPTQVNDDSPYVVKASGQDVDVNVLQEEPGISGGPLRRPAWGAASMMLMENGFPATFTEGATTPTPRSPDVTPTWSWNPAEDPTPTAEKRDDPVASLLSDIKEKSTVPTGGIGQIAPPQRRKNNPSTVNFTLNGGSSSSSGSDSGSPTTKRQAAAPFRPSSPRPSTPPYPGSPKRFLSPLPSGPIFPAGRSAVGTHSPLRLSPVNSSSQLADDAQQAAPAPATSELASPTSAGDAVYQAFVRQWCFAQAPGPTVGATVGAASAPATPTTPKVGINV